MDTQKQLNVPLELVLELLAALANLCATPALRDVVFSPDDATLTHKTVELVMVAMESNCGKDCDILAQGFRLFGCLTRFDERPEVEEEVIDSFVCILGNI
jgi:hypothetical protein